MQPYHHIPAHRQPSVSSTRTLVPTPRSTRLVIHQTPTATCLDMNDSEAVWRLRRILEAISAGTSRSRLESVPVGEPQAGEETTTTGAQSPVEGGEYEMDYEDDAVIVEHVGPLLVPALKLKPRWRKRKARSAFLRLCLTIHVKVLKPMAKVVRRLGRTKSALLCGVL